MLQYCTVNTYSNLHVYYDTTTSKYLTEVALTLAYGFILLSWCHFYVIIITAFILPLDV